MCALANEARVFRYLSYRKAISVWTRRNYRTREVAFDIGIATGATDEGG